MARACVNRACEWHDGGACRLFPGEWGFLQCRHADKGGGPEKTSGKTKAKAKTAKGRH